MTHREFVDLVERMRDAQKAWFRTRDYEKLDESKRLEREVDAAVKAAKDPQPKLFA